jgi:hypothetical protein
VTAAAAARAGALLVYKALDGGWQRAVLRGSVCADERIVKNNGGALTTDPAVDCGDAGAP